jgi:hypothetical protein
MTCGGGTKGIEKNEAAAAPGDAAAGRAAPRERKPSREGRLDKGQGELL